MQKRHTHGIFRYSEGAIPKPEDPMALPTNPPEPAAESALPRPAPCPSLTNTDTLARLGAELWRRHDESQPALEAAWDTLMASWGITGEPIGVDRLRHQIQEESGGDPAGNDFSRELIAQREGGRP